MLQGKTLTELAAELERQNESKHDYTARSGAVSMVLDEIVEETQRQAKMELPGQGRFDINRVAHSQLAAYTRIPKEYYDRMPPSLLAINVNHWLQDKDEPRMIRTMDGNVRAWLSDRYRPLDNYDLAVAVIPTLRKAGAEINSSEVTDSRLYIKATSPKITATVKQGDVVQAGVLISNSEVGMGALQVAPFSLRLVCVNGMTHTDYGRRKAHLGRQQLGDSELPEEWMRDDTRLASDAAFFGQVRDLVNGWFDGRRFEEVVVEKMRESTERKIEADLIKVVEVTQKRYGFTEQERSGVLTALVEGGDATQWGLANAITRMSANLTDYDRATEVESIGGQVVELGQHKWEEILNAASIN